MVGRALDGEIERDLQPVRRAGGDQAAEVVERAELGMERVVPALGAADRIGAAGIVRRRRSARCSCPCGWCGRSDGSAGNRARRSPARRSRAGGRCSRRRCRAGPATRLWLRGKISYQAPARARGRSTTSGKAWLQVRSGSGSRVRHGAAPSVSSSRTCAADASVERSIAADVRRARRRYGPRSTRQQSSRPSRELERHVGARLRLSR